MQLALPDLTETEKLMISLKFKSEKRIESRREEREILLKNMREKKKIVKDRAVHNGQMITNVYMKQAK
jgi:hypothetical protein